MQTVVSNTRIKLPYNLCNCIISELTPSDIKLTIKFTPSFSNNLNPLIDSDGYIEFDKVNWDLSYVYLFDFESISQQNNPFTGQKHNLKEFSNKFNEMNIKILNEAYGNDCAIFEGIVSCKEFSSQCYINISFTGSMKYIINYK